MKAIYYAGLVVGIEALVRASRAAIPPSAGHVRTRDADAWLQQPQQGIEKFDAVVIPEGEQYDALAEAYASADADVVRGGPEASACWLEKPADEAPPPPPPPPPPEPEPEPEPEPVAAPAAQATEPAQPPAQPQRKRGAQA